MSLKERLGLTQEPLWLMDGSAFIFRGFYAFQNMQRSDGFPTNALFIVTRILLRFLREENPRYFSFVLDGKGPTFRHNLYPLYKAQRSATPEPLVQQLDPIKRMVGALGLQLELSNGCEADDCIASLTARFSKERPVVIIGADKDLKQCLKPNVVLWDPGAKEEKLITLDVFHTETGLEPSQWPDVQAVIGDSSDNIPGVPGIGPKTASKIFSDFSSLEDIRDRFDALPPNLQKKFASHLDAMFLYRQLTTLSTDCCPDISLEELAVRPVDPREASTMLQEFELRALARELSAMMNNGQVRIANTPRSNGSTGNSASPADSNGGMLSGATPGGTGSANATAGQAKDGASGPAFGEPGWDPFKITPATSGSGTAATEGTAAANAAARPLNGDAPKNVASNGRLAAQQISLFGDAPRRLASVSLCSDPAELPACAGHPAAVVPIMNNGNRLAFAIASGDRECRYSGPVAPLAAHLAAASSIAVPDYKAMLRADAVWSSIPVKQWFDLGLAAYLLDPEERDYGWPRLSARWGDELDRSIDNPGLLALEMSTALASRLAASSLDALMTGLEMPLVPVLASMEEAGIAVNRAAFAAFLDEVQKELDRLTQDVYRVAGGPFNIRSAQQLGELLFKTLELPTVGKTRGGQATTSQEALEKLSGRHPVVDIILDYRKLEKLRSTYLEPLPRLVDASNRIHTTFNQLATATGRLSSSNPNLQNIPARGDLGRRMRSCFTAAPGNRLVSADYSQIELRVLAHMSQDPTLLAAFREGDDIHRRTAGLLYDTPPADVTPDQRRNAKTINFGLIYGMGPQKLAQELRITVNEAKQFIERYFSRLQHLKAFYESVENMAREQGYVTTMAGRRRLLPEMHSANTQLRSQARRQAINTLIQGSAADIIKLAMLAAHGDATLHGLDARLILQVHDELLLEVPAATAEAAGKRLAELMMDVHPGGITLDVPLLVDWGTGTDWGSAH